MEYADTIGTGLMGAKEKRDQDSRLAEAFEHEARRLRNFIRRRVPDEFDAEDILQDVFYELTEAYRPVSYTHLIVLSRCPDTLITSSTRPITQM